MAPPQARAAASRIRRPRPQRHGPDHGRDPESLRAHADGQQVAQLWRGVGQEDRAKVDRRADQDEGRQDGPSDEAGDRGRPDDRDPAMRSGRPASRRPVARAEERDEQRGLTERDDVVDEGRSSKIGTMPTRHR